MISTGNDIVALKAINIARSKQPKFYSKFISAAEKDLYDKQAADKMTLEIFVWLLWSVKEASFKYLQRITPQLVFSPTKIIVEQLTLPSQVVTKLEGNKTEGAGFDEQTVYKGIIRFGTQKLCSRTIIGDEFIASFVNQEDHFENICWGIQWLESPDHAYQSQSVRALLINRLINFFPGEDIQINKSPLGFPILLMESKDLDIPVSLAHHDHYVAYSFPLTV